MQYAFQLGFLFSTSQENELRHIYTQVFMIYHSDMHKSKRTLSKHEVILLPCFRQSLLDHFPLRSSLLPWSLRCHPLASRSPANAVVTSRPFYKFGCWHFLGLTWSRLQVFRQELILFPNGRDVVCSLWSCGLGRPATRNGNRMGTCAHVATILLAVSQNQL